MSMESVREALTDYTTTTQHGDATMYGYPYDRTHHHRLDDIASYVLVRTSWDENCTNVQREDIAPYDGPHAYSAAIDRAHELRRQATGRTFYVVDTVYACGCRSIA